MNRNHPFAVWLCLTLVGALAMLGAFWFGIQGGVMLFMLFAVISIVVLGARDNFNYSKRQSERTEQFSQRAAELGFDFQEAAPFNLLGWDNVFALTKQAFPLDAAIDELSLLGKFVSSGMPKSRNVLLRSVEEARLALFDYRFSDNDVIYHQATAAIQSPRLDHPYFALFPANMGHKFLDGFQKVPVVHDDHRLVTEANISVTDIAAIAETLDANTTLEVCDGYLLLYRSNRRPLNPEDIETKISELMRVYAAVIKTPAMR
jgi:hypothetical protein